MAWISSQVKFTCSGEVGDSFPLVPVVCVVLVVPSSCILVSTLLLLFLSLVLNSLSLSCSDILGFSNKFISIRCSGLCVVNLALFFGISSGNFCTIPWPVFIISLPYISYILQPCILGKIGRAHV